MLLAVLALQAAAEPAQPAGLPELEKGIEAVMVPQSAERDGVLTVSDGNLFVQCLNSQYLPAWRCDAAGFEGEPWLRHVLTAARQERLIALGFRPDKETGNFVAFLPKATPPDALEERILLVLRDAYGVRPDDITVRAEQVKSGLCHRRIKPNADLGGSILTPRWGFAKDAAKDCRTVSGADALNRDDPAAVLPDVGGIDLDALYVRPMTAELQRLETVGKGHDAYVIFDATPAYVQCMHDRDGDRMYCEAASDDAVGKPVERILTPERKAKLIEAGFEPPGKVMNYRRFYPRAQYDMEAVAKALIDVLRQAYGYRGAPAMTVATETGHKRPLAP